MAAMRLRTGAFAFAIAGCFVTVAFAQGTNYTSVEAIAGKPVRLTYHAAANNCVAAPPPTIRVTQPPKDGILMVRKAMLTTEKVAGCLDPYK